MYTSACASCVLVPHIIEERPCVYYLDLVYAVSTAGKSADVEDDTGGDEEEVK